MDNLPFSDDFTYIDPGSHIATAPNPFYFFSPWSEYFKSWSLSYFFLWIFYKIFAQDLIFYRLINLTLHFFNFLVFRKILIKETPSIYKTLSLIFLFHPVSILTTSWVFQFKTLLATFFLLLFYLKLIDKNGKKKSSKLVTLFFLSITSKVIIVLTPLILLVDYICKKNKKLILTRAVPLLFISLIYGLLNIKGITQRISEINFSKETIVTSTDIAPQQKSESAIVKNPVINLKQELSHATQNYFEPYLYSDSIFNKISIALNNLGRLAFSAIGFNYYQPFYEDNIVTAIQPITYFYIGVGTLLLIMLVFNPAYIGFWTLALFIPISGLFYVPYMKFSYTSDHWFYPVVGFFLIALFKRVPNKIKLSSYLFVIILISYVLSIYNYKNYQSLLEKNQKIYSNPYIAKSLFPYYAISRDYPTLKKELIKHIFESAHNDLKTYQDLAKLAFETNDQSLMLFLYSRMIPMAMNTSDYNDVRVQHIIFMPYAQNDLYRALPLLISIDTNQINLKEYQGTLKYLE